MTAARVRLLGVAASLPPTVRTSEEVEDLLLNRNPGLRMRRGTIAAMTGIRERRVAADHVQCSDLAVEAAKCALLRAGLTTADVDVLIFAAAGQDLVEPATAHIVQHKLGTTCQVFDVKNACNSFLNGIQLAECLILTGQARTALVTTGEVCSRVIDWRAADSNELKRNMPAYTMGDAGAAAVLGSSREGGIYFRRFAALSEHWELATIAAGGSMHPRGEEHTYLRGDGARLKQAFVDEGSRLFRDMMCETRTSFDDFARIFVHQVSVPYHQEMLDASGMPADRVVRTIETHGNMASATIPVAHSMAFERGEIVPGDRVMWVGMASGISVGVLMMDV
jgi:acyl-CoA:acyl-CoA alkyltransferase